MSHAPEKPRAPISVEMLGKNREFGSAPYDVAGPLSTLAQGAYDLKTAPLYAFPPTAPLGMAIDTAEGVASGSPAQVAMGALGGPLKVARNVIAPLAVATGVTAPDEAEAARLPRVGGVASALSKVGPQTADTSLEQAMNVARQALQQPRELSPLGFYSHGAETAAGLQQAKGTPEQYAAMLQKAGVKPAELEGFGEAFAGRPSVTREEIAAHFKERMPQIEETVLGGSKPDLAKSWETVDRLSNDLFDAGITEHTPIARGTYDINLYPPETRPAVEELAAAHRNIREQSDAGRTVANAPTKFGQYTLPGGENYREVLLKMPSDAKAPTFEQWYEKTHIKPLENYADDPRMMEMFRNKYDAEVKNMPKEVSFKSSHWDDPNVLAHLRMSDRTGPNGEKILHVEEIQSDWGQKGKKEGFGFAPGEREASEQKMSQLADQRDQLRLSNTPEALAEAEAIQAQILQISREGNTKLDGVPPAPYVTNTQAWTDLALKRALREAAEGGYDKLVWTPGAEQSKRYDLSKQVGKIYYDPELAGGTLAAEGLRPGQTILDKPNIKPEDIADYIGKEAAEKLLSQPRDPNGMHMLEGNGLSMGGEGMKGYYDKIVPNQLSKLVKKLDPEAKIGRDSIGSGKYEVVLPNGKVIAEYPEKVSADIIARKQPGATVRQNGLEVPSLTITPKMREAIMKGQTAFKNGGSVVDHALMLVSKQA